METAVDIVIDSRVSELTRGFKVRRALPSVRRRMVGPFIFVDQMGPEILTAGTGLDVAPHPHIGLATVTYLFKGEIVHRDSLGTVQTIFPGEVNWMTAGSGTAHSERTPPGIRTNGGELFGIQTWVALPEASEENDAEFFHHRADELPAINDRDVSVRLIAGSLFGLTSPVKTFSHMFYADVTITSGGKLSIPSEHEERAIYVVNGVIKLDSDPDDFAAGQLLVLKPKAEVVMSAVSSSATVMLLGGDPIGKRHIYWNFVSSSKERIEQAKTDWREGRFEPVPGETEFIPLPPDTGRPVVVRYP